MIAELHEQDVCSLAPEELKALAHLGPGGIGEVPIVSVHFPGMRPVHLVLHGYNPGGSMKDIPAWNILQNLLASGRLEHGGWVVDATSGNWGISVAWLCRALGLRFIAVTDTRVTPDNLRRLRQLADGGEAGRVEVVDRPARRGGLLAARIQRARELADPDLEVPGRPDGPTPVWLNQYRNRDNWMAHRTITATWIARWASEHRVRLDYIFVVGSTGGTWAGVSSYFKKRNGDERPTIVVVDGEGSSMWGPAAPGPRLVNGLGAPMSCKFRRIGVLDRREVVSAEQAFRYCRGLAEIGVSVGGSSGAAVAAAHRVLAAEPAANAIVICADDGWNYRGTIFDDDWLRANAPGALQYEGLVSR
jgi:N-(2-amino-2-carboxyethyl)-L-glutamate synthase